MEDGKENQKNTVKADNGKASGEKYIHVSEIPTQKLDDDKDFRDSLKNKRDSAIDPKPKEPQQPETGKDNETMGIP